jgi:PAS domain S-box-containing protein
LQPLLGAYLLRRWLGPQSPLAGVGPVFRFLGVGLVMCLVAPSIGVTSLYLAGYAPLADYSLNWWTWWLGDVMGVFLVTPLVLAWWKPPGFVGGAERVGEAVLLLGVLLVVELWVFGGWDLWGLDSRFLVYLTVPPLVWATLRFGAPGATLGLLGVTGIAVWGTAQGNGPFVRGTLNESLLLLQTFMGVVTVMALTLVGVLTERQRTERELQRADDGLTDFIENAAVGLHWVGPDGVILWAYQAELDLVGYQREECIGHHISEFHADPEVIDDILYRLVNYETLHDYEARLKCKDGSIKHVLIDSNVFWQDGHFIHTRCFTRDITPRKEAQESARQLAEEMALVDQVARIITSTLDIGQVYERFATELKKLVDFERVAINIVGPTGDTFKFQDVAGPAYPGRGTSSRWKVP